MSSKKKSQTKSKSNFTFKSSNYLQFWEREKEISVTHFFDKVTGGKSAPNFFNRAGRNNIYQRLNMNMEVVEMSLEKNAENENQQMTDRSNAFKSRPPNYSPFYKKKTLTILTETSEFSEIINPNLYFFTPKDTVNTFSLNNKKNSFFISTTGYSSTSSMNFRDLRDYRNKFTQQYDHFGQYEFNMLSDRSVKSICSKSTLKKAEEFLECLKSVDVEKEKGLDINDEEVNKTLNCYLVTDNSQGNQDQIENPPILQMDIKSKWQMENIVYKAESFNLQGREISIYNGDKIKHFKGLFKSLALLCLIFSTLLYLKGIYFSSFSKNNLSDPTSQRYSNSNYSMNTLSNDNMGIVPINSSKYEVIYHKSFSELISSFNNTNILNSPN